MSAAWATLASASAMRSAARRVSGGRQPGISIGVTTTPEASSAAQAALRASLTALSSGPSAARSRIPTCCGAPEVALPSSEPGHQFAGAATASRSSGSKLARSAMSAAASRGSCASTPMQSSVADSGRTPVRGIRPAVGLSPATPQQAAGMRTEPIVSVPSASAQKPAATAAAEPEEEPPGVKPGRSGFSQGGNPGACPEAPSAPSSMAVLPRMTRPALRADVTTGASCCAMRPRKAARPAVQGSPATSMLSLTASVRPSNGERARPDRRRSSERSASARAPSGSTCQKAPTEGFRRSIRSREASSRPRAVASPAASARACSPAGRMDKSSSNPVLLQRAFRHCRTAMGQSMKQGRRQRSERSAESWLCGATCC